jgi:DNA-binding transcriptional MerR regulator
MNIAEAARRAALTPKAVRFYEAQGLLSPRRAGNGYRTFGEADVHALRFLRRARNLGFSVEECQALLALYGKEGRPPNGVQGRAEMHLRDVDRRLADLQAIRQALVQLADWREGDPPPHFPDFEENELPPRRRRSVGAGQD